MANTADSVWLACGGIFFSNQPKGNEPAGHSATQKLVSWEILILGRYMMVLPKTIGKPFFRECLGCLELSPQTEIGCVQDSVKVREQGFFPRATRSARTIFPVKSDFRSPHLGLGKRSGISRPCRRNHKRHTFYTPAAYAHGFDWPNSKIESGRSTRKGSLSYGVSRGLATSRTSHPPSATRLSLWPAFRPGSLCRSERGSGL